MGRTPWGPESAYAAPGLYDATKASRWGWLNFDWSDGSAMWQDKLPGHHDEAGMGEQCKRIKALGTGTRCFVYRNTELALQWEETSRAAMTQRNVDAGWFLRYKTKAGCDASVPCNVAAYHNANQLPLIPCNNKKPINISAPNCGNCCNFTGSNGTGAYNEPIGGPWPVTPGGGPRFGTNALGDGQLFWDYRTQEVRDYFAKEVLLAGAASKDVDGFFTDDPGGFGQEHPSVQAWVQLTPAEVTALQRGTQQAWMQGLALLAKAKKYIAQAYRITPPFVPSPTTACASWMRSQCAVPANESTLVFPPAKGNLSMAAFLVARGPFAYIGASKATIENGTSSDPLFLLHRYDTGEPTGACTEAKKGVFSRAWSKGKAIVDCTTATGTLDFKLLEALQ